MSTQGALSAIGGAIDRATLALLWLGRGVFVIAATYAAFAIAAGGYTWARPWLTPPEVTITEAPDAAFPRTDPAGRVDKNFKIEVADWFSFDVKAPDEPAAIEKAGPEIGHRFDSRMWGWFFQALVALICGALVFGLTRVTRWIVTGR